MLKREKHRAYSNERKRCEKQILETEQKIIESKRNERLEKEKQCIDSLKENPKVFYSFINKQRNRKVEVGPFIKEEMFIYNGKELRGSSASYSLWSLGHKIIVQFWILAYG